MSVKFVRLPDKNSGWQYNPAKIGLPHDPLGQRAHLSYNGEIVIGLNDDGSFTVNDDKWDQLETADGGY